ncbi:MAG: hypothetical protein ACI8PZ_006460 [Myxococcota bacterium]|jgi:hypothetical protein
MWWWFVLACTVSSTGPSDRPATTPVPTTPPSTPTQPTGTTSDPHTADTAPSGDTSDTGATPHTGHTGDTGDSGGPPTTPTTPWIPPDHPVALEPGPTVICADPAAREVLRFDRTELVPVAPMDPALPGSGVLVADLTGDATPELLFAGEGWLSAHGWDGAAWQEIGATLLPGVEIGKAWTLSAADVDGDLDLDLFIGTGGVNQLLRNDGGVLVDATDESGLGDTAWSTVSASWADFDRDGDLDLVVGNYGAGPDEGSVLLRPTHPSELYRNDGGTFVDISDQLPEEVQTGFVFMTAWLDVDADGWPELLTLHDFGWVRAPSRMLHNDRGRLQLDLATAFHPNFAGMGLAVADIDQDGGVDLAQSSASDISLLFAEPEPVAHVGWSWAIESAPAYRLFVDLVTQGQRFGWGMEFTDLDHDGDEDLPMLFGWWSEYPDPYEEQRDAMFEYDASERRFTDRAREWGVDDGGAGRGLAVADLNGDGWPDLVKRQLGLASNLVYTSRCGDAHWLRVVLQDDTSANRHGIGARLEVSADHQRWTRWIHAGSRSMFASMPAEAHVGLGDITSVDLTVVWPDGQESHHPGVDVDQVLTVRRGD